MPFIFVQTVMEASSSIPRDESVNTWAFLTGGDPETDAGVISGVLNTFYETLEGYFAHSLTGVIRHFCYQPASLSPGPIGSPIFVSPDFEIEVSGGDSLPNECAVAMSFRNTLETMVPPGRRRGRVFLGPLGTVSSDGGVSPEFVARPGEGFLGLVVSTAETMAADASASDCIWSVWSRANAELYPVTQVWVDNEYDTIRGRGRRPTMRTVGG